MNSDNENLSTPPEPVSLVNLLQDSSSMENETIYEGDEHGWRVVWESPFPPLDIDIRCPACRNSVVACTFQRQMSPDDATRIITLSEKFERECERCHYKFYQSVRKELE